MPEKHYPKIFKKLILIDNIANDKQVFKLPDDINKLNSPFYLFHTSSGVLQKITIKSINKVMKDK